MDKSRRKETNRLKRKITPAIALILVALLILGGCAEGELSRQAVFNPNPSVVEDTQVATTPGRTSTYDGPPGTWAIYWYLCGTDLESRAGAATTDLFEMMEATLPENVTVVIQAGGASEWDNDFINPYALDRQVYAGNELTRVGTSPMASMGDPNTFADFLKFCNEEYPAEKQMVLLWNHGGGSLAGVSFDEGFGWDSLSLPEFKSAIEAVPAASGAYELVGFDACLMATLEMAEILADDARYLVASQEVEPLGGWDYRGFFNALAANTTMDGAQLGTAICDTYYAGCEEAEQSPEEATLSVIDLDKTAPLLDAFNEVGNEALLLAVKEQEAYLSQFRRAALDTKSFGGGDCEMVDLGDLVRNAGSLLPQKGAELLQALDDCVVYQIRGEYHAGASGLSCYYNLSGDPDSVADFRSLGTCEPFLYFHEYSIRGSLSEDGQAYVQSLAEQAGEPVPAIVPLSQTSDMNLNGFPVSVGANRRWQMNLGSERAQNIAAVFTNLYWVETVSGLQAMYGVNSGLTADYGNGIFTEDFTDTWGCIDNMQVYMEPIGMEPGLILYAVPVMLNSEEYTLHVGYDMSSGEYEILGAWKDENRDIKAPGRIMRQLEVGDVIEPIQLLIPVHADGSRSEEWMPLGMVTVTENTRFHERNIGTGYFALLFKMVDYAGNVYTSAQASFRVRQGQIERLPNGIVPMTTTQPEGSISASYLSLETFRHPDRDEDITYYTVILSSLMYQSMKEALGLPNPQWGDQISGQGYTIQIYSDTLNLDAYVDAKEFYLTGMFFAAETIYHQRDIVMRIDSIAEVW